MNEVAQVGTDPADGTRTPKGAHTVKSHCFGSVGGGGGGGGGKWRLDSGFERTPRGVLSAPLSYMVTFHV